MECISCGPTGVAMAALAIMLAPVASHAGVFGTLGNFDVVNDTGSTAHGFEIDLEGLSISDITDTFGGAGRGFPTTVERYGSPTISLLPSGTGVSIVYESGITGGLWNVGTASGSFNTPGESCWTGGSASYPNIACDHFGVGTRANPTNTTYKWLVESSPGSLALNPVVATIPAPTWTVTPVASPPGQPPAPPKVAAVIPAPVLIPLPSPEAPDPQFGTPIWVKVFTTEYDQKVQLEDLVANNAKVPDKNNGVTEVEWQLMQFDPGNPNGALNELDSGDKQAGANAESVLRRYEFYKYTGTLSADGAGEATCENPTRSTCGPVSAFDPNLYGVGSFIGAQNAAVNLNGNPLPVPEPETWALMIAGMIGVVVRVRRGRRN